MAKAMMNTLLFSIVIWALIAFDVKTHGSLESSKTGRLLKDAGLLIYVKPYYNIIEEKSNSLYRWGEKNFPYKEVSAVRNKTAELSRKVMNETIMFTQDAASFIRKYALISYNYVSSKLPPDLADKVSNFSSSWLQYIKEQVLKIRKWFADISKDSLTWQNVEKVYFETASKVGVYYSKTTAWVERKFKCLISA